MLGNIIILVVDSIASIVTGALLLRFWMQAVRVRPPMQVAQFVFQVSDWLVKPLRKVLPGLGGYDWASLVGAFLMVLASVAAYLLMRGFFSPEALAVFSVLRLVRWAIYGLTALLILEVIFSWVNPHAPLAPFVRAMNDPLLGPFRRLLPPLGGLDLSPMVVLLIFQIVLQALP